MRLYAVVVLGAVALILMLLNLYGIYELVLLFTRLSSISHDKPTHIKGSSFHSHSSHSFPSSSSDHDKADPITSTTVESTTRPVRLKYKFDRTTGEWSKRPVEQSTVPSHRTSYRVRKPSTGRWYFYYESTTPPPPPPSPSSPSTTTTGMSTLRTTSESFTMSVKVTTYREQLPTHRHHPHRHHHHHSTHETTRITATPPPTVPTRVQSSTILTHRPSRPLPDHRLPSVHDIHTLPPSPSPSTSPPSPTTIRVHAPSARREEDDEDGILIEREDLIGQEKAPSSLPPIHVTRGQTIPSTSRPLIVVDNEGESRLVVEEGATTLAPEVTTNVEEEGGMTVVTALMDIGRGEWFEYRRPLEKYHQYMENVLSLKVNMVIFTDATSVDFVHKYRKEMGLTEKTKVYNITLEELPLYRYYFHAQKIIEDELKNPDLWRAWDPQMQKHPEAKSPEYDVLVNSKTYFLYNATLEDPFHSDWFVWLDAGYGHGDQTPFPIDNKWTPRFPRRKISLIKVTPEHDQLANWTLERLYRHNWSVISGGFLAGERHAIGQLYSLVHRKFIELVNMDRVDDDQTVLVLVINSAPHLFNIVHGDWFDAFAKFPSVK